MKRCRRDAQAQVERLRSEFDADPARDRFAPRPDDTDAVAQWRARLSTSDAKHIYKRRTATSEHANARARNNGLTRFIVRGLDEARAVARWHALAIATACARRYATA